jgi:signal transduction histidine kinase
MLYGEQQQKQKEAAAKQYAIEEQKLQAQKDLRNIFVTALAVAIIIALLLYNRYRLKQRVAFALETKNKIINEQKLHAEKLREEAEESKKMKEQFLANMSHEIRTPMNAIKGITELLSEKTHDDESLRYIHAISQSSNNLLVILNDVLDLSKIQAGKFFIQRVTFSLKEQVGLVYDTLLVLANEKRIDLILNYDATIPNYLEGDPVRINQVLYNLINNAIKFTDTGTVHIDIKSEKLIPENETSKEKSLITFTITDTGSGIPADKQQTIFESFTQLASPKNHQQGTGLGLTISKLLVELMHGKIFLESTEGKGTVFSIQLPLIIPIASGVIELNEDSNEAIAVLNDIKILIAEDNPYNRMMITDTLRKKLAGASFDVVSNGRGSDRPTSVQRV